VSLSVMPVVVEGDEHQLRQVVGNLLANARAHTPPGTPVRVSVRFDAGTSLAHLEVADEGPGMAPDVAAHVFDRFFRADASRGRGAGAGAGSGLGLAIVAGIAESHGGRAGVESAPGAGSRFVVELPARAA
jgi:two-component system OmpR family sensor kinase